MDTSGKGFHSIGYAPADATRWVPVSMRSGDFERIRDIFDGAVCAA
jgi:hypothetical protein